MLRRILLSLISTALLFLSLPLVSQAQIQEVHIGIAGMT